MALSLRKELITFAFLAEVANNELTCYFQHLMKDSIVFSHLMDEYGNLEHEKQTAGSKEIEGHALARQNKLGDKGVSAALMQTEERNTGAVTWEIYSKYLGFAGGLLWVPAIIMLLVFVQATQGANCPLYCSHV